MFFWVIRGCLAGVEPDVDGSGVALGASCDFAKCFCIRSTKGAHSYPHCLHLALFGAVFSNSPQIGSNFLPGVDMSYLK